MKKSNSLGDRFKSIFDPKEADEVLKKDNNAVFFYGREIGEFVLEGYPCKINAADNSYLKTSIAFGFQKNSPYRKFLSHFLLKMKQLDQIGRLHTMYKTQLMKMKSSHGECNNQSGNFSIITLENVISVFLIIMVGILLGVMILFIERMSHYGYLKCCNIFEL